MSLPWSQRVLQDRKKSNPFPQQLGCRVGSGLAQRRLSERHVIALENEP